MSGTFVEEVKIELGDIKGSILVVQKESFAKAWQQRRHAFPIAPVAYYFGFCGPFFALG